MFILTKFIEILTDHIDDSTFNECQFNSITIPKMKLNNYLINRINHCLSHNFNIDIEESIYIVTLYFILKMNEEHILHITSYNIHRILLITLTLTIKMYKDDHPSNHCLSRVGGIPLKELNELERFLIKKLNYNLSIDISVYNEFIEKYKLGIKNKI